MAWGWGWGFVLSFGYWCTDFLVVQRAMAAESMDAARRTPLIAAFPKMIFPFLVIVPGLIADCTDAGGWRGRVQAAGQGRWHVELRHDDSDDAGALLSAGAAGLGLTALMASFMSGMAGNVTAFNTVFTYDIYGAYIRPG